MPHPTSLTNSARDAPPGASSVARAPPSVPATLVVRRDCKPGDEKLPWDEQEGKHRLLLIVSGRFRNAQLNWHIVEKEAYPFGVRLMDFEHWVNGGRYPAALFTDHRNLLALFDDRARPGTCSQPNRDRLHRWGLALRSMRYEIFHISGEKNYLADLGSRWGSRFTVSSQNKKNGVTTNPTVMVKRLFSALTPRSQKAILVGTC